MSEPDPYRSLVEHAPYGIFRSTPEGRILRANPALVRMLGYESEEEVLELDLERDVYVDPAEREGLVARHADEPYRGLVSRWHRADGTPFTVRLSGTPIREQGELRVFETFVEDISGTVRAEAELRESRARYRTLVEHSPDAIAVHDGERFLFANPAAADLIGVDDPGQIVGQPVLDLLPPGRREVVRERMERVLSTGEPMPPLRLPVLRADGTTGAAEVTGVATRWRGRSTVLLMARDVSERERAEARLARALDASGAFLYVLEPIDDGFRFEWVNEGVESLLGYAREEILDPGWFPRNLHPDDRDEVRAAAGRAMEEDEVVHEFRFRHADGEYRWFREELRPMEPDAEGPPRIVGVAVDVTERRRMQERAEEGRRLSALTTMAAGIAHHFNNRLTALRGYADLALMDLPADADLRDDVRGIVENAQAAARLAERILAFAGGRRVRPSTVILQEVVRGAVRDFQDAGGDPAPVRLHLADEPLEVRADPDHLREALRELLDNAARATADGGSVTVVLEASGPRLAGVPDAGAPTHASLRVEDTGVGMDEDALAHCREPFFSTRPGDSASDAEGRGLGLSTVHGVARELGGDLRIESEPGAGTVVELLIPLEGGEAGGEAR